MKKVFIKGAISLMLVIITVFSVSAFSLSGVSAANDQSYELELWTEGGNAPTMNDVWVNIHGTTGSTGWVNLGNVIHSSLFEYKVRTCVNFNAPAVGEIVSIDTKVDGTDGWYPESISVWQGVGQDGLFIPCGKWVDNGEVVNFYRSNLAYAVTVKTADVKNAGTDRNVYATLIDENGVCSEKTNLSNLVGGEKLNAFEKGDEITVTIAVPENFGNIDQIKFELSGGSSIASGWMLEWVSVWTWHGGHTTVNGNDFVKVNQWGDKGKPIIVDF